jgi:hypothetical protein
MSRANRLPSRETLSPARALADVVVLAIVAGAAVAAWVFVAHHGWDYYTTPLRIRGYHPEHRFLRPSGIGGHLLGIAGTFFLFLTLLYVARKKFRFLARFGSVPRWLTAHVFCGVFGPLLITLHTSLKFNGIISVAYWSMVLVVLSGFIGRSLYIRIPKSLRGKELSRAEIEQRARELKAGLADLQLPPEVAAAFAEVERAIEPPAPPRTFAERRRQAGAVRRSLRTLAHAVRDAKHADHDTLTAALETERERALLVRSIDRLERTKQLFQLWHVFHRPLVWVMFAIFFVHLSVALYFGYTALW